MDWNSFKRSLEEQSERDDTENSKFLSLLMEWWLTELSSIEVTDSDKETAWNNFLRKTGKRRSVFSIAPLWKYAAMLAIIGNITYALWPKLNKITTAASQKSTVEFTDGSRVFLNSQTRIQYNQQDWNDVRQIRLQGEAFFEVARDEHTPFIVDLGDQQVKVLGTSFNVRSIEEEAAVEVTVQSGKVSFSSQGQSITLQAGEKGIYNRVSRTLSKDGANPNDLAWHTSELRYKATPLSKIISELEKLHRVDIQVENPALLNCKVTTFIEFEKPEDILDVLQRTIGFEYSRTNQTIVIDGTGC